MIRGWRIVAAARGGCRWPSGQRRARDRQEKRVNDGTTGRTDLKMSPSRLDDGRELVLRVMPMPADVNGNGDIFGGWVMAQVDVAGAVLPFRIAKGRIATVAVNQFIFKQPVSMGDLLSFYAKVTRIGTTSVSVHVDVYAERNPANLQVVKVTEADLTYVAIDKEGRPRPLPT
jgi:acyl-CoA thioesterase YciA